jgi:hypothetical protein
MNKSELQRADYVAIMEGCVAAWNRGDAEGVASFYTDDLDYRDPTVPKGISNKGDFIKYLKLIFKVWPEQEWVGKEIMPHEKKGSFSVNYDFKFANGERVVKGNGIDRIEFRGDKICLNHVYLNADKWREWMSNLIT